MAAVVHMALKDLRLLLRDRFGLFWIFVFPLIYALFFGTIFGGGGGSRGSISVVVIDQAQTDASRKFTKRIADADGLGVDSEDAGLSLEDARELVRKGDRVAYIRVPADYGQNAFAMFQPPTEGERIEIGIDPSRTAERGLIEGMVTQLAFQDVFTQFSDDQAMAKQIATFRDDLKSDNGLNPADRMILDTFMGSLDSLLQQTDFQMTTAGGTGGDRPATSVVEMVEVIKDTSGRPQSSFELTFPSSIVWALMGCVATFSLSMVRERTMGTLLRLRVAPLSLAQILAGKALACFLACLTVAAVLLLIGFAILGVRIASWPLMLAALLCSAACFTGIMMSISVIGKTENAVGSAGWGVLMPLAMVGGGMIPLVAMPSWLWSASHISPFKWAIYSLEGAVWRDFTFSELALPLAILLGIGALFFTIGVTILRRTIT